MSDTFYMEPLEKSEPQRRLYVDSVNEAVRVLRAAAAARQDAYVDPIRMAAERERYRAEYASLLGIDLCRELFGSGVPEAELETASDDEHETISRVKLKIAEGIYFTGLLFVPKNREDRAPLALMSHGGGGSPQLCSDLIKPNNYGGVVRMLLSRGVVVFAPQLLLWQFVPSEKNPNIPPYTTSYNRGQTEHEMRQCGASIAAFEVYEFSRALDWLSTLSFVDPERVGMLGLSYGGFYTLHTMAYDTRIRCGWSAAIFNDRVKHCRYDMSWKNAAATFLDPEIAALCAPRKLWIDYGRNDPVYESSELPRLYRRTEEYFAAAGVPENVRCNLWDGVHRFSTDDGALEFFLRGMGM